MRRSLTDEAERTITTPRRVSTIIAASKTMKRGERNPGGFAEILRSFLRLLEVVLVFTIQPKVFPVVKLL